VTNFNDFNIRQDLETKHNIKEKKQRLKSKPMCSEGEVSMSTREGEGHPTIERRGTIQTYRKMEETCG